MLAIRLFSAVLVGALIAFAPVSHAQPPRDPLLARLVAESAANRPISTTAGAEQGVATHMVAYGRIDGRRVHGYLARSRNAARPMPALLVIHEWSGLNDHIRALTRRLAAEGYTALAVDLYYGKIAKTPARARALRDAALRHPARIRRNLRQAYLYLDVMPSTSRVGSIGWCFGGGWSLRTALLFPRTLDAAVVYYGELFTDAEVLRPLAMPILGHFGADDPSIPPARVRRFGEVLKTLGIPHELYIYPAAGHAFANPSGRHYVRAAAQRAWRRTIAFLDRTLAAPESAGSQ